ALTIIKAGAERVVTVSEAEMAEAMRLYFRCAHTVAEGAGAAALAALMKERRKLRGKRAAVILSGGNVDVAKFAAVLGGITPQP
ncbi:MAG: pyridoxal-phosphate dependent enzyme, partial [Alphaproteobacteria bacterium]|nr:pyridoxal-phosphate dependent enzyme [Alphaproteobacteria bacterium]